MSKTLSFAALLALPLMLAAGSSRAAAAPAAYCAFNSPASSVCPTDIAPPVRAAGRVASVDHCVVLTPASSACPAVPAGRLAATSGKTQVSVQVSRN